MPETRVNIPGVGFVNFPDGMTPDQISQESAKLHLQATNASVTPQEQGRAATDRLTGSLEGGLGPTQLSPGRSFVERAAGAAPEVIGTTIGGIAGAAAGPAGAGLGGLLGAGAGESLRQLLAASGIAPRAFGTLQTGEGAAVKDLEKTRNAAMFGAATEFGGAKVAKALPGLFKRKLSPSQSRDIGILEREGIPYSAGDIRPLGPLGQAENLMRGTLAGGGPAGAFEQGQREAVDQFKSRVLNQFGPMMTKEEVGEALQTAVKGRHQDLISSGGVFDRAYRRISAIFPAKVDTASIRNRVEPIKAELDKLTAEGRIGAAAKSKENPSRFTDLVDRMAKFGLDKDGKEIPLTYADVWKDKQSLDALVRSMSPDDPLRTRAKGTLKQLHGILDGAMEDAAQQASPQAAARVRAVNKAYAETKRLFELDSPVAKIGDMDPERIVQKFFQPGAVTPAKDLMAALKQNPAMLPPLRRRVAENLFEGIGKEIEDVRVTPAGQLRDRIAKSREGLKVLFSNDQLAGLDEFVQASSRAQAMGRTANPASGRQMLAMSQMEKSAGMIQLLATGALSIGGTAAGNATTGLIAGSTAVFGPAVLSRALFNPKIARLLAKGFELKPGTAEAVKWSMRATNALRSIESQEEE